MVLGEVMKTTVPEVLADWDYLPTRSGVIISIITFKIKNLTNAGSYYRSAVFSTLLPQRNPLYDACVPTHAMLRQLNSDADYEAEIVC